jgi:beta-lactamase class A
VDEAVRAFAANDAGRSVAVKALRGIAVASEARGDVIRPGASLLKLPLVAAVHAAGSEGRLDLDAHVKRQELGPTAYPSVLAAFAPQRALTVNELCSLCLITSDNPTAEYLLALVGSDAVNQRAQELGCLDTRLETGFADEYLDAAGRANVTTARDALVLVSKLVSENAKIADALSNNLRNTRISLRLPFDVRAPHKTGTLPGVANDAGVIFGESTDLAVAFLCDAQTDIPRSNIAIADCVAEIRRAVGERVRLPARE